MVSVNLKLARAISRRRFLRRIKTKIYKNRLLQLELHVTLTVNNIFVNFCNGVGNSLWARTFGMIGYMGSRRKTRYALYYYGITAGELLYEFLGRWKSKELKLNVKHLEVSDIPIRLVLHSAVSEITDFRYKRFMQGLLKSSFYFSSFFVKQGIPYNGCRLPKPRRTRRSRHFK